MKDGQIWPLPRSTPVPDLRHATLIPDDGWPESQPERASVPPARAEAGVALMRWENVFQIYASNGVMSMNFDAGGAGRNPNSGKREVWGEIGIALKLRGIFSEDD